MIKNLRIENFKSIKELNIGCKKINIFIGEPNAGKSNIIEAISVASLRDFSYLGDLVRHSNITDLFFDNQTENDVNIAIDDHRLLIHFYSEKVKFGFSVIVGDQGQIEYHQTDVSGKSFSYSSKETQYKHPNVAFYKYNPKINPNVLKPGSLQTPFGENLVSILTTNSNFKGIVSNIFKSKGFRINIKPVERELLISKEKNDEIYSYSYGNISETLKRIVFLLACIDTNSYTTLLFDEPEANTFPFYTKYIAERIALDKTNQYFFTTHNLYLLRSVIEKAEYDDIQIIITYMDDYQTKTRVLTKPEVEDVLEMDVFSNIDYFLNDAAKS